MATNVVELQRTESEVPTRLELVRVIRARRERVFDALTRPEVIRQWFGPGNRTVEEVVTDPKVSGEFHIAMSVPTDEVPPERRGLSSVRGHYTKVQPYDLLQFTWIPSWVPGEESLVTLTLRDVEDGTELTLVHEGLVKQGSLAGHTRGWTVGLHKLGDVVLSRGA